MDNRPSGLPKPKPKSEWQIVEPGWEELGSGNYNTAYVYKDRTIVFKVQIPRKDLETDIPERSIRVWGEINPGFPAEVASKKIRNSITGEVKIAEGWTCPFIKGEQASDLEMRQMVIDIYNRRGRILVDAVAPGNIIKSGDKVVCVDIGMALLLNKEEESSKKEELPKEEKSPRKRRTSIISLEAWEILKKEYTPWFKKYEDYGSLTMATVKALLFIKIYRPDISEVSFLSADSNFTKQLAAAYDDEVSEKPIKGYDLIQAKRQERQELFDELDKRFEVKPNEDKSPDAPLVAEPSSIPQEDKSDSPKENFNSLKERCSTILNECLKIGLTEYQAKKIASLTNRIKKAGDLDVLGELTEDLSNLSQGFSHEQDPRFFSQSKPKGAQSFVEDCLKCIKDAQQAQSPQPKTP